LKGDYRQFYYVEYPSANTMIDELRQGLYAGEILFLLRPAHAFYSDADVEISTSREAQAELSGDEAIYNFTLQSSLFTMSLLDASKLTSPLGASRDLLDLYTG